MLLVFFIDLIVLCVLCRIAITSGLEAALPFAAFVMVLVPIECSIPLGLFELTTHRLVIAILFVSYLSSGRTQATDRGVAMPLKILLLIHIAWCALSTANSVVPLMSVKKAVSIICEYYILYFVYWRMLSRVSTVRKVLLAMVLAMVVCSIFGAFEAYGSPNVLSFFPKTGHHFDMNAETDREIRVQSTYDHPILYGAALAMAILISLYLVTVTKKRWHTALLWAGLMLMFLNIYKTSSRGPWLDVMLGCLLLLFFAKGQVRKNITTICLLSILAMVVRPGIWATVRGIYDNSFDMNTSTGTSYEYRYALQNAVIDKVSSSNGRAAWGYGLESFYTIQLQGDFLGKPHLFLSCDSSWAELLLETGFVGLGIIVIILLRPAWQSYRAMKHFPSGQRDLNLVLLVNLLVFYFQMYSVGMYSWGQNGYMLWIVIAVIFALPWCEDDVSDDAMRLPALVLADPVAELQLI